MSLIATSADAPRHCRRRRRTAASHSSVADSATAVNSSHVDVLELPDTCNEAADEADPEAQAGPAPQEHHPEEQVEGESFGHRSWCHDGCESAAVTLSLQPTPPPPTPPAHSSSVVGAQQLGERRELPLCATCRA